MTPKVAPNARATQYTKDRNLIQVFERCNGSIFDGIGNDYGAIDLHKKDSQIRIVTEGGEVLDRRIATTRDRLMARRPHVVLSSNLGAPIVPSYTFGPHRRWNGILA